MATPQLPSSVSIVDYLNSQKQDSSFSARSRLYKEAGFDKTLGDFTGSATQNTNLLKYLQTNAPKPTSTASSTIEGYGMTPLPKAPAPSPLKPFTDFFGGLIPKTTTSSTIPPTVAAPKPTVPATASSTLQSAGYPTIKAPANYLGFGAPSPTPAPAAAPTASTVQSSTQPSVVNPNKDYYKQNDTNTKQSTGGVSGSTIYPDISFDDPTGGSEIDAINTWLNSAEGQAFLNRQEIKNSSEVSKGEATKAALEAKFATDKATLEEKLAENGLTFSGVRATQVKALADSLASSLLETDRDTASKLLLANQDLADAILKGVADLAKAAKEKNKDAIQQLNAIGYAVIGGKLIPTLAARSADRADVAQQISLERLDLAEQAAARSEARFEQLYGTGKKDQFSYVKELMDLNPNATRAELKAAALENTNLSSTEIDSVLDTVGLTGTQSTEVAKSLVASNFTAHFLKSDTADLEAARKAAKATLQATGGVIKVGGRTIALTVDQLNEMNSYIDTVTLEEAKQTKDILDKQK